MFNLVQIATLPLIALIGEKTNISANSPGGRVAPRHGIASLRAMSPAMG